MNFNYRQLELFFTKKIWYVRDDKFPPLKRHAFCALKKLVLTIECFIDRNLSSYASALTYSTILAIVPILAIIFAIGRGFGYGSIVENEIKKNLSMNKEFSDIIFNFIGSYLDHTQSGIFIGFGLLLLLYTVIQLTSNIEIALNEIWQVKTQRTVYRRITDYISVFFLLPILIIISSGISIFLATIAKHFPNFLILSTTVQFLIRLTPYLLSSLLFTGLYMYMPNTPIQFKNTIVPGVLAGVCFQLVQSFYIHSQIWVSTYNAIYGSFAALPMFMLWVNVSWFICLFGAQLSYANQNLKSYYYIKDIHKISRRYHDLLIIIIMSRICKRFEKGMTPYSVAGLAVETNLPVGVISTLVHELENMNIIIKEGNDQDTPPKIVPAEDINHISVNFLMEKIDRYGDFCSQKATELLSPKWSSLIKLRNNIFLDKKDILLKDLED